MLTDQFMSPSAAMERGREPVTLTVPPVTLTLRKENFATPPSTTPDAVAAPVMDGVAPLVLIVSVPAATLRSVVAPPAS